LNVVRISSNKIPWSNTVELDDVWKLVHTSVELVKFAQTGVGMLVSSQLENCVDEWIP